MRYDVGRFRRPMRRSTEGQLMSLISLGDGSTLTLDFTAMGGMLDSRFTFTRNSVATYIGSDGLVKTVAAAATNDPTKARFDHDPSTGALRGLLLEGASTNLVCGSETFATSGGSNNWSDSNITRDATPRTSPDGTANALRITAAAGNATVTNNLAITAATRTFSVWIRRVSGSGNIQLSRNTNDATPTWTTVTISSTWSRVSVTGTSTGNTGVGIRIVSASDVIEVWGAQVENGSQPSSYIQTTTSTATRVVEECRCAISAPAIGWNANPPAVSVLCRAYISRLGTSGFPQHLQFWVTSAGVAALSFSHNSAGYTQYASGSASSGTFGTSNQTGLTVGARSRVAHSPATTTNPMSVNGATASTIAANSALVMRVPDEIRLNYDNSGAYSNSVTFEIVKFWPTQFTQDQLNALTAS